MLVSEARDLVWSALIEVRDGEAGSPEVAARAIEELIRAVVTEVVGTPPTGDTER
jgi:hypothetical protein